MRLLFTIILLFSIANFANCQVERIEYFIDKDPGIDKATRLQYGDINWVFLDIEKSTLSEGLHTLGIRAKEINGGWSHTALYDFYVEHNTDKKLSSLITYLNNDTIISRNISENIDYKIPKKHLKNGFNNIFFETSNAENVARRESMNYYFDEGYSSKPNEILFAVRDTSEIIDLAKLRTIKLIRENDSLYQCKISRQNKDSAVKNLSCFIKDSSNRSSHFAQKRIKFPAVIDGSVPISADLVDYRNNFISINGLENDWSFEVYDINAKEYSTILLKQDHGINISCLPLGVYYLVINNKLYYKFVKSN